MIKCQNIPNDLAYMVIMVSSDFICTSHNGVVFIQKTCSVEFINFKIH